MFTRAKRQPRQRDRPCGSGNGCITLLLHCVHPANKMPVLLTGIFISRPAYSRARASTGSSRAALRAGSQPNSTPVSVEQRNAVSSASGEKPISQPGRNSCKIKAIISDNATPSAPPTRQTSTASMRNCCSTSLARAPTAMRMPISGFVRSPTPA